MSKKAILVVSFGTSYSATRQKTIGNIEQAIRAAFPEYEVRRAFTSRMIIRIIKEREGIQIDMEKEALERLREEGFEEVIVQPTHIIPGFEYDKVATVASSYRRYFKELRIGRPLLGREDDFKKTAVILQNIAKSYDREDEGIIFMGHGTEHPANDAYIALEHELILKGNRHVAIGTVEGQPDIHDIVLTAKAWNVSKLCLSPFMIVAGDHACQDMAGENEDSWKSILEREGFCLECRMKGLGEEEAVCREFVQRVREAEVV